MSTQNTKLKHIDGASSQSQDEIDQRNAAFWDELCGTQLADQLGVHDNSPESLKKFDDWYLNFYPYLYKHLPFAKMRDHKVLDVGLGYGTVAQKIAESGAHYHGLDIAPGPVSMAKYRCDLIDASDAVLRQGSILEPPFEDNHFDWVIAIGCLHHTGNLTEAIRTVHRLLKTGGQAMIMVYSAASYRQFSSDFSNTLKRKLNGSRTPYSQRGGEAPERGAYDQNLAGEAAPQTEFVTKSELRGLCSDFSKVKITAENIGAEGPLRHFPRPLLNTVLGPLFGLDLYCRLTK